MRCPEYVGHRAGQAGARGGKKGTTGVEWRVPLTCTIPSVYTPLVQRGKLRLREGRVKSKVTQQWEEAPSWF